MTPNTVVLDGAGIGPLTAGGKGSALDKLAALDVRIPSTGVITTAAYESFERVPEIAAFVADLKTGEIPRPTEHDEHIFDLDRRIPRADFQRLAIRVRLQRLEFHRPLAVFVCLRL